MEMPEIKPLTKFDAYRFHQLAAGYTSHQKYIVSKQETDGETLIRLTLQDLEKPYVKRWPEDPEMDAHYRALLEQGLSLGLYAEDVLVGIAIAEKADWNRSLKVWEFHIDPALRGQGHGRRLMDALAEIGLQAGCRVMVCEAQNTNVPAIRFYRKLGFAIEAVDLSLYTNTDISDFEVAVFMKRYLQT